MDSNEIVLVVLLGLSVGYISYEIGKNQGNSQGYKRAVNNYTQWAQTKSTENDYLRSENARLSQENGSLHRENEIVETLLRQQPTTPQAEAILKARGRVELRLAQTLLSAFENGEEHDTNVN
jgi:hypothetical protein